MVDLVVDGGNVGEMAEMMVTPKLEPQGGQITIPLQRGLIIL
jgi:hypothetical protein